MLNCCSFTSLMAVCLIQLMMGEELAIPREPTDAEIAACKITRDDMLQIAPTWEERFDLMTKAVIKPIYLCIHIYIYIYIYKFIYIYI